eukprot:5182723-Prymnesium_polylepis.1
MVLLWSILLRAPRPRIAEWPKSRESPRVHAGPRPTTVPRGATWCDRRMLQEVTGCSVPCRGKGVARGERLRGRAEPHSVAPGRRGCTGPRPTTAPRGATWCYRRLQDVTGRSPKGRESPK